MCIEYLNNISCIPAIRFLYLLSSRVKQDPRESIHTPNIKSLTSSLVARNYRTIESYVMANVVTYHMYSIRENCELHIEVLMNNQDMGGGGR